MLHQSESEAGHREPPAFTLPHHAAPVDRAHDRTLELEQRPAQGALAASTPDAALFFLVGPDSDHQLVLVAGGSVTRRRAKGEVPSAAQRCVAAPSTHQERVVRGRVERQARQSLVLLRLQG